MKKNQKHFVLITIPCHSVEELQQAKKAVLYHLEILNPKLSTEGNTLTVKVIPLDPQLFYPDEAIELLRYISNHNQERILVTIKGDFSQTYYLQQAEKEALTDTYHLGIVMRDINQLERAIRISNLQIEKYQRRQDKKSQDVELNK